MDEGVEVMEELRDKINDLIIKTMIMSVPSISHLMKSCHADDIENQYCF